MEESNTVVEILVVDDNPNNLKLLRSLLTEKGMRVRLATNGEMALKSVQTNLPTLILLDVNMPGINGFETCELLKQDVRTCDVPVIFLTSLSDGADIVKAFNVGGADFVSKPFQTEVLMARILTQLHLAQARRQLIIENQERRAAEESAQLANRMKSDFLANMSHEIRTPMNAIVGLTHLCLNTELNNRQRTYLKKVQLSGQHLLGILNDILDFSKIEAGRLAVECIPFNLTTTFENLVTVIGDKAAEKKLELITDIAPDVPLDLEGDPLRLGQILINYVNNAIKFTEKGEIVIVVRVQEKDDKEVLLSFEVNDTGIGLTEAQIGGLFSSFSQADNSITRKYGGTGLGLAISKALAGLMGGTVGVSSQFGKGSCFWCTIRCGIGTAANAAQSKRPSRLDVRGSRVLVVDDNVTAASVMSNMLQNMGFQTDTVYSGQDAIDKVQHAAKADENYDIVMMDLQMPGMDGVQSSRAIRALNLPHAPRQILVTAYSLDEAMLHCEAADFSQILQKPVNASTLLDSIVELTPESDGHDNGLNTGSLHFNSHVLLVEDNEINQEIAQELLAMVGITIDIADHGEIALAKLNAITDGEQPYDLILMDMQMPVMDGVTTTRAIRKIPRFDNLPILAMTANAMPEDNEECIEAGMNGFISKPIAPEYLWKTLAKWLKQA